MSFTSNDPGGLGCSPPQTVDRLLVHQSYTARLRSLYQESVFETTIPEAAAFKVALACSQPVQFYADKTPAARLTGQLAHEMLQRIRAREAPRQVA